MISHQHRCIFVHIPKCGGTSIEDMLWPEPRKTEDLWMGFVDKYNNKYQTGGLQHLLARQIREEVGADVFEDYYKFSFVRDPWDRMVSQFEYTRCRKDLMKFIGLKARDGFKRYLDLIQERKHVQWEKQAEFVTDEDGKIIVDFVGRLEDIASGMATVYKELGLDMIDVPHSKKSRRRSCVDYYDDESRDLVSRLYKEDIELFGYEFPMS